MNATDPLGDIHLITVTVVDISDTARRLYGDKAAEIAGLMGRVMPEHDYRFKAATPTGGEVSFHQGASADHIAAYWEREGWLGSTPQPVTVEATDDMARSVLAEAEYMGLEIGLAGAGQLLRAALEAAGFTVTDGGDVR